MARTVRNAKIDTASARAKLKRRREPYWTALGKGRALGYRRGVNGGSWIARFRDNKQHYKALGSADDLNDGNDLSYDEAQELARDWFVEFLSFNKIGPYTVRDAMKDYLAGFAPGSGEHATVRSHIEAHIEPALGDIEISDLEATEIKDWLAGIAVSAPMVRSGKIKKRKERPLPSTRTEKRRRESTANRILTTLKAGLNKAHAAKKVSSDTEWRRVKPFKKADSARVRYLSDEECKRLVNACQPVFRPLVQAALLTGCRYGELVSLTPSDFDGTAGTLYVETTKGGPERHVTLTDEGQEFFKQLCIGNADSRLLFTKADGSPWKRFDQRRPFIAACGAAKISPAVGFHTLRHTYASRLAARAVPMAIIAKQLGHADTRMVEKHYAHLAPSYVADTIRANFPSLGIVEPGNVIKLNG